MPYTSDNQVSAYAALNERGPSRIGQLLLQQRPSWFTYATKDLIDYPQRLPRSVAAALAALQSANPELAKKHYALITEERPLPVLGTNGMYGLDFAVHLALVGIDISPGGNIPLPPTLAPLKAQRIAARFDLVGGVGLPDAQTLAGLTLPPIQPRVPNFKNDLATKNQAVISVPTMTGFSAGLTAVFGARSGWDPDEDHNLPPRVTVTFDGLDVSGAFDPKLETVIDGVANTIVQLVVLPRLDALIPRSKTLSIKRDTHTPTQTIHFELKYDVALYLPLTLPPSSPPGSGSLPTYNPAFEDNQLKLYLTVKKSTP